MKRAVTATVDWMMRRRALLPRWVVRSMESVARNPDGVLGRMAYRFMGVDDETPSTVVPESAVRVYIAPTNYAGQGYRWARALEQADDDIQARNVAVTLPGGYAFPADLSVPIAVANGSAAWGRKEWEKARKFTHVLIEAERPMFGATFARSVENELLALESDGVSVAYLCHGTDIRDPDRHAMRTPWSPYPDDPRTELLREDARVNLDLITRVRRPTFLSTPDLVDDVPWGHWCPVVIDVAAFSARRPAFEGTSVNVLHTSSSSVQKGSHLLEPALRPLIDVAAIDYRSVTAAPAAQMPALYATTDIVLDQFRLGSYGVAACEAMAAGRLVIGHVLPDVRKAIEDEHGLALPIVEATLDTVGQVVERMIEDRAEAAAIADSGPEFVRRVHSGAASARALIDHWIAPTCGRDAA